MTLSAAAQLRGKKAWLLVPSSLAAMPIGAATIYYAIQTVDAPPGSTRPLIFWSVVAGVLITVLLNLSYGRKLRMLARLSNGQEPASHENVRRAVSEVHRMPDHVFRATLGTWVVGMAAVSLGVSLTVPGYTWLHVVRMAFTGLVLSPVAALLAQVVTSLRARQLITQLARMGLSVEEVVAAIPATRMQLRRRFLLFGSILVITPCVVTADVAVTVLRSGFARMASAPPEQHDEIARAAVTDALRSVFVVAGLVFSVALTAVYLVGEALGQPMRALAQEASRIASGDLRSAALIPGDDEVWVLSAAFAKMHAQLFHVVSQLQRAGIQIAAATEQLQSVSARSQSGAHSQASSVHQTSATTEELARVAGQIAESAGEVAHIAGDTLSAAQSGQSSSRTFIESMDKMKHEHRAVAESVTTLNQRVQQIGRIVEFINGIADKSDLLALNAELEGTKAGEVGRGFSLVAGEMRRLAENVMRSTREIEQRIGEIRDATRVAVTATEAGLKATDVGVVIAREMTQNLERILELALNTSRSASAISVATQQQQSSSADLAEAMASILRVTEENVATTKTMGASSGGLAALAKELKAAVDQFTIGPRER